MSPPTILVVGATGNTGKGVVETLPGLLKSSEKLSGSRILALTRSLNSSTAQKLSQIPGVEFEEISWPEITSSWLEERNVKRAFIASHNEPTHFAEESTFLREALEAKVEYVVRISTTAANVKSNHRAYYPRTHWAIEQLLSSPEYSQMHWTSLQPNVFTQLVLGPAVSFVKEYQKARKQSPLKVIIAEDVPNAPIHSGDVGILAAHLLAREDTAKYNQAKLVLNGPDDTTGAGIVKMAEEAAGIKVEDVRYKDVSFIDDMAAAGPYSRNVMLSIKHAPETGWEGKTKASGTSKEVLELAAPSRTVSDVWKELLQG